MPKAEMATEEEVDPQGRSGKARDVSDDPVTPGMVHVIAWGRSGGGEGTATAKT